MSSTYYWSFTLLKEGRAYILPSSGYVLPARDDRVALQSRKQREVYKVAFAYHHREPRTEAMDYRIVLVPVQEHLANMDVTEHIRALDAAHKYGEHTWDT